MKIDRITVWRVELPLHEDCYSWSGGNFVETFDSTIVEAATDTELGIAPDFSVLGDPVLVIA